MSVEFRQRKPGEYLKILRRRKWLIILPIIAVTAAVSIVVYKLPDVFESSTLIVVTPATLPNNMVTSTNEDSLTRQLTSITQVVTSRSSLEPLVEKYDLYRPERTRGEALESIIQTMRKDIKVEVNTSRNDITNGFNITFRGSVPQTTQAVTRELARKYIDEQKQATVDLSRSAKGFIDSQVTQAQTDLTALDNERLDFMTKNSGSLPSESAVLLSQLGGLRDNQKALMTEIGRLQDRRSASVNQLALIKQNTANQIDDFSENITDPKTTQGWAQLVSRKAALEGELTRLKQELTPKHPDVIAKQKEIEQVKQEMDSQIAEWQDKIKEKQKKLSSRPDLTAGQIQEEIKFTENEIKRQQKALSDTEGQISELVNRINLVPEAEIKLDKLNRDYATKKAAVDQLLQSQQKISLNAEATSQEQGEGIKVVDDANLPSQPVAPKRLALASSGLIVGLALGLLLAAIFEVPRLLTIENSEDAQHYTGLPVLISVPELLTPQEARAIPRRRRLVLAAGVAATIISIPVLALVLKLTHVFEFLIQSRAS